MKTTVAVISVFIALLATKLQAGEIHDAAAAGDLNKVKALLEADPTLLESKDDRTVSNLKDNTPLISACWAPPSGTPQVAVANFLIDKGANVNAKNERGATPLYFATKSYEIAQRLIAKGAEVNTRAFGDFTPLHQAAFSGNLKVAKLLIDHGADLNSRGAVGTVIQKIIYSKTESGTEMVKLLLEGGAKLNQNFSFGNTELHLAALNDYAEVIPILVKHGADANAINDYGHAPLYYAAMHGYRKAAEALIAAGASNSAIVEANYDKSPQLNEKLKEGEAYLWYLGGTESPYSGYAVKTKSHLLIFNPTEIDDSPEAGLANGHLNPNELAGQKTTALILYPSYQGPLGRPSISELAKRLPGINLVLNKPTADRTGSDLPPFHLATPHENFSVDDVQVHTIPATRQLWFSSDGLGYLVEADGVKIFHAGAHASSNEASEVEKYRKEIDYLKSFGPIDIAILPVNGRHLWWIDYQSYLYLIDQLSQKAIYLIGDDLAKGEHRKCIDVLRVRNVPVFYPQGGIAVGERFHYVRDQAPPLTNTVASSKARASFQGLGDFPGGAFESLAQRISANGLVVIGYGTTALGKQAFRWTEGEGMVSLGNLPDGSFKSSWASGISADGAVIVGYGDPDGSGDWTRHRGYRWSRDKGMVKLDGPSEPTREAFAVSADGSVIVGDGGSQAFRWTQTGGITALGTLPGRTNSRAIAVSADASVIVGSSYNLPSWEKEEAYIWTQAGRMEGLGVPSGSVGSFPNAISADGSVIVGTITGAGVFRWSRSTGMTSLGHFPGAKVTHPSAVTADGAILVGTSFVDRRAPGTAFIWDASHGMRSLQNVLENDYGLKLSGWNLQNASSITPDGTVIVGWGTNPAGQQEAFRVVLDAAPTAPHQKTSASQSVAATRSRIPTLHGPYLGQKPPGKTPEVFAKGIVSIEGKNTHAVQFSPDGKLLIFSRYPDGTSYKMVQSANGWSAPEPTSFRGKEVSFDPASKRLFYYDQAGDLLFVHYGPDGFSQPIKLPSTINTKETEYYPSVTAKGNLFFSRNGRWSEARIQVVKLEGDGFGQPIDLGQPINVGGASHEFVSPDESYILFNSPRPGSHTENDIWVSFHNQDGSWTSPVNLGERINRDAKAVLCPTVSPDGRYLFFTRLQENLTGNVYWVSTEILGPLRAVALSNTAVPASRSVTGLPQENSK